MILQYKGFNNNWCYEEADTITSAVVYVGELAESYRNKRNKYEEEIHYFDEVFKAVNEFIIKETGCDAEIAYHVDRQIDQLGNVVVVMLSDKNKYVTRVFESANNPVDRPTNAVYLLNNHGQTVMKLA